MLTPKNIMKSFLGSLWEHLLDGIFERQVEGLCWEVADAVCEVASPKSTHALFGLDA